MSGGQTLAEVRAALDAGGVVLLPTETVYGLAARADNSAAIDRIFAIKGRDFDKPLAICIRDLEQAERFGVFDATSRALAAQHWPGSLTLVVNTVSRTNLDPRVMGAAEGGPTIALRCPDAAWRDGLDLPLALTSANRSGQPDCTSLKSALSEVGLGIDAALSTDAPLSGEPSTILSVIDGMPRILRQGQLVITEAQS